VVISLSSPLGAQSIVRIRVDASQVNHGDAASCVAYFRKADIAQGVGSATPEDTVQLDIVKSSADTTASAALQEDLTLRLDYHEEGRILTTEATHRFHVGTGALHEARISLWRPNNSAPVCVLEPFPANVSFARADAFTTHTDIIATGEVSNSLRSGSDNVATTGSLGFHHMSFPQAGGRRARFPFSSATVDGEDLRVVISVASTIDSVTGSEGNFAQAVLLPANGSTGGFKSVDLEYFPFHMYGQHQEFGPFFRLAANQSRWAPSKAKIPPDTVDSVFATTNAVIVAFDARLRWVVINRVSETDENSLSFTIDGGYIRRSVDGDVVALMNRRILSAALGDSTRTHFGGWAAGAYLRLRQVTAYADFQCLSCSVFGARPFGKKSTSPILSLEGLQPIIGFRFEAPFFTVPN
jgi:hypothetical protein